jgi:tetratricopeptide (TPR) repeat protein
MRQKRKNNGLFLIFSGGIALSGVISPGLAFAAQSNNGKAGQTAASFLDVNPSVRQAALGGSQAAVHGELADMSGNPASITTLFVPELWIAHNQSILGTRYNHLGFGAPFKNQAVAFSAHYIGEDSVDRATLDGSDNILTGQGSFQFSTALLQASYARKLGDKMSMGFTAKGWHEGRDKTSDTSWAADAGILVPRLLGSLDMGLAFRNIGPDVNGYSLPQSAALGAAYHLRPNQKIIRKMSFVSELDFASHRDTALRLGAEIHQRNTWLRAGYQNLSADLEETLAQFSFGAGIRIKGWKLDYAWVPTGDLGDQHRLSISIGLGMTPEERQAQARKLDLAMKARMAEHANTHFKAGEAAMTKGKYENAKHAFAQALTWDPDHKGAQGQLKVAEGKLKFATASRLYKEGKTLSNKNQWLEAALKWEETLKLVPSYTEAKKDLARAKKKINASAKKSASKKSPLNKPYQNGIHFYLEGNYRGALCEWEKVMAKDPRFENVQAYIEKAKNKQLEARLEAATKEKKTSTMELDVLNKQAYTLYMLGKVESAIKTWRKVILIDPNNKDAQVALQEAQRKKSLLAGADSSPTIPRVKQLNLEAMRAYSSGHLREAATLWKKALVLDPHNSHVENNLRRVEGELVTEIQ